MPIKSKRPASTRSVPKKRAKPAPKKPVARRASQPVDATEAKTMAKSTTRHALKLGVDAGNISVADMGWLLENGADAITSRNKKPFAVLAVPSGRCKVAIKIARTIYGRIDERFTLSVPSGRLFVGDVGYVFSKAWDAFIQKTNVLLDRNAFFRSFGTGADGEYAVTIEVPGGVRER
jgi:hypothetical protein